MHTHTCPHIAHIPHMSIHSPLHICISCLYMPACLEPGPRCPPQEEWTKVSYQVHSKPFHNTSCRKSPQGGPRDQINESKCSFGGWQWQKQLNWGQLTNSVSRPVLVACGAENSQGQCGGWGGVTLSWEEWVKSFWGTEHSDHWMHISWRSLAILCRDGKESAIPSELDNPDKQAKFRF